jgi:hypothetical protein
VNKSVPVYRSVSKSIDTKHRVPLRSESAFASTPISPVKYGLSVRHQTGGQFETPR